MRTPLAITCLLAATTTIAGCSSDPTKGYSIGWTFDEDIRTVEVPVFENITFVTGIERDLTDAVIKRIQSRTPWRVTTGPRADSTLSGEITDIRRQFLSQDPISGFAQELTVSVAVSVTWRDNRTGETLVDVRNYSASDAYIATRGVEGEPGERTELGERGAVDELAEAIVSLMRDRW